MPSKMHCRFCHSDDHWMKNYETITCPKLKEKKLKEKEARREAKIKKNFSTPVQKVEPIKTSSNFTDMRALMDLDEQHEATTMIQKHVRRCFAAASAARRRRRSTRRRRTTWPASTVRSRRRSARRRPRSHRAALTLTLALT